MDEVAKEWLLRMDDAFMNGRQVSERRQARVYRDVRAEARRGERERERAEKALRPVPSPDLRMGDFREVLADVRDVDLVFTDPPYPREFLPLWSALGAWAADALKPGRLLVAYSGQYHLPEVLRRLEEHLEYVWTGWLDTPGSANAVHRRPIVSRGKPILFFSCGSVRAEPRYEDWYPSWDRKQRTLHEWEQALPAATRMLDVLSDPGDLVVDPFLGSGTFAVAAGRIGRAFVGAEVDPVAFETARNRLAEDPATLCARGSTSGARG